MLSRALPRVVARRVVRPAMGTTIRRFTKGPENNDGIQQEVVSFDGGKRVDKSIVGQISSIKPEAGDAKKITMPFDHSVVEQLTPTMRKFLLVGKTVVITGGARGLGFNMAQAMAEVGAKGIAIIDQKSDVGIPAAEELSEQAGINVRFYEVDIRDTAQIEGAVQDIQEHFGKIDVLVNSAGIADSNIPAETYGDEMWEKTIDVNLNGAFKVARAVGRNMMANKNPGSIIYIASMSGSIVNYPQEQSCYNASKAAVVHLTHSLAAEWAKYNIRVNAISPGYMDTALNRVPALDAQKKIWIAQTPQGRLGNVDELNNLAVFLASDASSYMTGSNTIIDGGYCLY